MTGVESLGDGSGSVGDGSGEAREARGPEGPLPAAGEGPGPRGGAGEHALAVLEFPRVLSLVAGHATSELGAETVRALRPRPDAAAGGAELRTVDETVSFLIRDDRWAPGPIPDLRAGCRRLRVQGSVLDPPDLQGIAVLLATARKARREILRFSAEFERLAGLARELLKAPELQERLELSFDEAGEVADAASSDLKRIRRELRDGRAALVDRLEAYIRGLPERIQVPNASVTVRSGRYCIPIRREGRSKVGGIVHDESASHQTLFVEPPLAIEPMNEIRQLELAEEREVRRVLRELTDRARPRADELSASLGILAEMDSLYARARYALDHGGARPEIGRGDVRGEYRVREGRHPLLLASDEPTVPFDLALEPEERVLLVSGPNAGGKTVLLKAIGLLSAMAQSGILPPVGGDTRLPAFGRFFAVIGDEQSIDASLSTFSAQVWNLRTILEESDGRSLILVDEIGSHTDPSEGAALAAAVLLRLAGQAALTVATTHLGDLKALAAEHPEIVNASLQFDAEALRPTYRLRRDRPGRSYALEIAGRLGLAPDVLDEARSRLTRDERALEELLGEVERREAELERLEKTARRRAAEAERRAEEVRTRLEEAERRERDAERDARKRAERYLLEARDRVEETIRELEARYAEAVGASGGEGADGEGETAGEAGPAGEAAAEARRRVERAVREARREMPDARPPGRGAGPPDELEDLKEGDTVRIRSLDRTGEVRELRGDRVVVAAGGVRLTLPAGDLERVEDPSGPDDGGETRDRSLPRVPSSPERRPGVEPRSEVDLRGLRVDEVEPPLTDAVDAAIYGDLPRLRVIHGKGTGALRQRVRELLREDPRVQRFRTGAFDEGGSGVTIIEFEETDEREEP